METETLRIFVKILTGYAAETKMQIGMATDGKTWSYWMNQRKRALRCLRVLTSALVERINTTVKPYYSGINDSAIHAAVRDLTIDQYRGFPTRSGDL